MQITKRSLPQEFQNLLVLMQQVNFGNIQNLEIEDGRPVITDETIIEREVKMGGLNGVRPETAEEDFALKQECVELFRQISQIPDGRISRIEIKHGLPFLMRVIERAA